MKKPKNRASPLSNKAPMCTVMALSSDDAWRMGPSPPRVITRSILWAPWPVVNSYDDIRIAGAAIVQYIG
jgi:hypothetical protein